MPDHVPGTHARYPTTRCTTHYPSTHHHPLPGGPPAWPLTMGAVQRPRGGHQASFGLKTKRVVDDLITRFGDSQETHWPGVQNC